MHVDLITLSWLHCPHTLPVIIICRYSYTVASQNHTTCILATSLSNIVPPNNRLSCTILEITKPFQRGGRIACSQAFFTSSSWSLPVCKCVQWHHVLTGRQKGKNAQKTNLKVLSCDVCPMTGGQKKIMATSSCFVVVYLKRWEMLKTEKGVTHNYVYMANHLTAFQQLPRYIYNYTVPGNILPPLSS